MSSVVHIETSQASVSPVAAGMLPVTASVPVKVLDPSGAPVEQVWNRNYAEGGLIFGSEVSQTAMNLMQAMNGEVGAQNHRRVADAGSGTGRDTIAFALRGFVAIGVDIAKRGLELAEGQYQKVKQQISLTGTAQFHHGDIQTTFSRFVGNLDGISSHRTLHLMQKAQIDDFAACASELLKPNGFLSIGARSTKDFKSDEMDWIVDGVSAKYKDPLRAGQVLNFVTEKQLRETFGKDFDILSISEGSEIERVGRNVHTNLIFMVARRKSESAVIKSAL